jgi:hypothetical protein
MIAATLGSMAENNLHNQRDGARSNLMHSNPAQYPTGTLDHARKSAPR